MRGLPYICRLKDRNFRKRKEVYHGGKNKVKDRCRCKGREQGEGQSLQELRQQSGCRYGCLFYGKEKNEARLLRRVKDGQKKSYEYINDFLYFVIRPDGKDRGNNAFLYCSGVNISRFLPITKGRHRLGQNPAEKGLQSVNLGVRSLALSRRATPRTIRGNDCAGIAPVKNDLWYSDLLLIENAPESLPDEIINYAVVNLLKKIFLACMVEEKMPDDLLNPGELQTFIEAMCSKYGR